VRAGFAERLVRRGRQAGTEVLTAVLALLVCLTPLRGQLTGPAYWVLADAGAAVLVFAALLGRDGVFGRLYAVALFGGLALLSVWLVLDGMVLLPALLVAYSIRALLFAVRGGAEPKELVERVIVALMVAGVPGLVAYSWLQASVVPEAVFSAIFFLCSAWLYLYPFAEWVSSYRPSAGAG